MKYFRALALLAALMACRKDSDAAGTAQYASLQMLDTARIRIVTHTDTVVVVAELAESSAEHSMGLMERRELEASAGMLFLYSAPQPETAGYWMFRTRIPLDIAFIDSVGVIRSIRTMTPCESTLAEGCPSYPPGSRYQAALEVNAGFFRRRGVGLGDRVVLADTLDRHRVPRPRG